jgi:methionyl-tRNA formyltransferase
VKVTLVGSRWFGSAALAMMLEQRFEIPRVIVPAADDRLVTHARKAGIDVAVQDNPHLVPGCAVPEGTDLIVTAHSHARVSREALARARFGGIGYHPSLLPRHRGIAAVEWTIRAGDPIAGGSIYHLAERMDAGAIAAQEWCFVRKGETARELWERALGPMGLDLLRKVIRHAREHGFIPAKAQEEQYATQAPLIHEPTSAD